MSPWENFFDDAQRTPFRPFDDAFRNVANRVERMMAPGWQGWQGYAARPCARWGVAEEAGTEVRYPSAAGQRVLVYHVVRQRERGWWGG